VLEQKLWQPMGADGDAVMLLAVTRQV